MNHENVTRDSGDELRNLSLYMARAIVDHPEQVQVDTVEGASMTVLELRVNPDDMGRVIGKKGRVANAMRTLLRTSATQAGKRVQLEIIED